MIHFDLTKTGAVGHASGLTRAGRRLFAELGSAATAFHWDHAGSLPQRSDDWFLTAEIFSPDERPGWRPPDEHTRSRRAAIFHDAIPLKHPHITWPQSVARHPAYMKMLAGFDHVWAVSEASRRELQSFWSWQGVEKTPSVDVLSLGADFDGVPRLTSPRAEQAPSFHCVGIVEPRKNQELLLSVAEDLWAEGQLFELHFVGRVNPHFGRPIVRRIQEARQRGRAVILHEAGSDAVLRELWGKARATVFPTIAEGCGLPLLESLWQGVPCICSDLPVLTENAKDGGCHLVPVNDREAWKEGMRQLIADGDLVRRLGIEAVTRPLPTWSAAAKVIRDRLN